jgi:hypothetical protein
MALLFAFKVTKCIEEYENDKIEYMRRGKADLHVLEPESLRLLDAGRALAGGQALPLLTCKHKLSALFTEQGTHCKKRDGKIANLFFIVYSIFWFSAAVCAGIVIVVQVQAFGKSLGFRKPRAKPRPDDLNSSLRRRM